MSQIRKQSLISSLLVYVGFFVGFLNTYLFTREGSGFSQSDYGLVGIFVAIATVMFSFANLGMQAYIFKFFPYYNDNLDRKENDQLTWALFISLIGFALVTLGGFVFKDLVIAKFGTNSPGLVKYYTWLFPFGLGLSIFSVLEVYAWQLKKSVLTNFLREILFRLTTTVLIVLVSWGLLNSFTLFIILYSFSYLFVALLLFGYLLFTKKISIIFRLSKVTKKFSRKIATLATLVYGGGLVMSISQVFDSIIIAAVLPDGLALAGIYTLAQNIASLVQAPQRGIISSSIAALSKAWKDKDMPRISRIYRSSSINLLLFAVGMFSLIWLNFTDGIFTFHLKSQYIDARWVFFYIGLMRIVDMGSGVNAQIINTSTLWRFDFITGIILLAITLPFNYIMTKHYGITGPAIANLISFTIYNTIRYVFLLKKFGMQPFNIKSVYTIALGIVGYYAAWFLFHDNNGFMAIVLRSSLFLAIYVSGAIFLNISPDIIPMWNSLQRRLGMKKGDPLEELR